MSLALAEPLLQAVLESPDEDAPRIIFADWLEDNGADEYAEFIRLQCELAMRRSYLPKSVDESTWSVEVAARMDYLRSRELGLMPFQLPYVVNQKWSRGFLSAVQLTADEWMRHGQTLVREQPIERAELIGSGRTLHIEWRGPRDGRWVLWLDPVATVSDRVIYPTRAALIDAMPQQLREWGVGAPTVRNLPMELTHEITIPNRPYLLAAIQSSRAEMQEQIREAIESGLNVPSFGQ